MKHTTLLLFVWFLAISGIRAQDDWLAPRTQVNALRPEKQFFRSELGAVVAEDIQDLLKQALKHCEIKATQQLAILSNGVYLSKALGNGQFYPKDERNKLSVIILDSVQSLTLRYAPSYQVEGLDLSFWGTLDIRWNLPPAPIETLLGEEFNPITQRLLEQVSKNKDKEKIPASSIVRANVFAGAITNTEAFFFGGGIEVPLLQRLSLNGEALFNADNYFAFIEDLNGKLVEGDFTYRAVEIRTLLTVYVNHKYQRFYGNIGPSVQFGRQRRRNFDQLPGRIQNSRPMPGVHIGAGVQFVGGLYVHAGIYTPLGYDAIPEREVLSGLTLSVGYRFGGP